MLLLTRRPGQAISIQPGNGLDWQMPLGSLFGDGPIEVVVNRINDEGVKIGIRAHSDLVILRNELIPHQTGPNQSGLQSQLQSRPQSRLQPNAQSSPQSSALSPPFAAIAKKNGWGSRRILARNVTHYRNSLQLTGRQLADISGLSLTTLLAIEEGMGAVYLDDLDSLAKVFSTPVWRLLNC